jgi:hypothetical protein
VTPAAVLSILVKTQGVDNAQRQLAGLDSSGQKAGGTMKGFLAGAAKTGAFAVAAAGVAAAGAAAKMVDLASDAEETASKFKTVFGRETGSATKALDEFSRATGTSKFALRDQAAGLQALIRPMGLNTKNAADMSVGMTKLATDLASFNNTSVDEAITALKSGLVGESEPLRKFGVQLSANRIEAYAYANGIAKTGEDLTAAQKAQASYGLIMQDTTLAQGDAVKTAGSFANQFKRLKSQVTDIATEFGMKLIPVVTAVVGWITSFIDQLRSGEGAGGAFAGAIKAAWDAVKTAVSTAIEFVKGYLVDHKDDVDAARQAVERIAGAMKWAFLEVILPAIQAVMPTIQKIIESTMKQIGGAFDIIIGLINGDWTRAWNGLKAIVKGAVDKMLAVLDLAWPLFKKAGAALITAIIEGFKSLPGLITDLGKWLWSHTDDAIKFYLESYAKIGKWILDKMIDGLKAAPDLVTGAAKWVWNHLDDAIKLYLESYKSLGGWILGKIMDGLKALGTRALEAVKAIKNAIVEAVKDVFKDAVSIPLKISLPKVNLPFGGVGGGNVGPVSGSGVDQFNDDAARFGNMITSGFRPGDRGWHGQNRARDYAMYMATMFGGRLLELIHTPLGFGIKNGHRVPLSFWGPRVNNDHFDHVHVALANGGKVQRGGWAVVGERGPELAHLPSGTSVYSNSDSRGLLGGPTVLNAVIDLGRGISERVRLEFDENGRQVRNAYRAGVAP